MALPEHQHERSDVSAEYYRCAGMPAHRVKQISIASARMPEDNLGMNAIARPTVFAVAVMFFLLGARPAFSQEWTLTTADFQTSPVLLRGLSADGFSIVSSDTKTPGVVPLNQFVSISRTAGDEPVVPANFTLLMTNGDRLTGEPGSVTSEKLTWLSTSLGSLPIPFNKLLCINRGLDVSVPDQRPKQDVATLSNGDTVSGVFTDCADLKVTIQADAGPTSLPLESIKRIVFAATGGHGVADSARAFRIRLTDSSILTVADAKSDGTKLTVTLQGKNAPTVEVPMSIVLGIEQLNGPVGWLSSMTPIENVQIPYLGGEAAWPARFDRSVDGSPLSFDGHIYEHGIGVHAYSRLSYGIDPQWKVFRTQYAIDSRRDQPRKYADVTVRIKLDGKVVHEERNFREGVISPVILLDLNGAKTLTLECDYGDAGDTQAHLDWLDAAFLHERPASATEPTTGPTTRLGLAP
jgi:hypothetical protein